MGGDLTEDFCTSGKQALVRILHVTPAFYPAHAYGGPIESVYQLCRQLVGHGCQVRVLTTNADGPYQVLDVPTEREVEICAGLRVRYCKRLSPHSVSAMFLRVLPSYVRWAEVVHLTAVYSFPTIPTFVACRMLGKPVVWSPRGALQRWEHTRRPALKAIWEDVCWILKPKKLVLHVTSETEASQRRGRFGDAETVLIPNGVQIPAKVDHTVSDGVFRLLYLGRIHPIKGIENLLTACKMLQGGWGIAWSLTIAGAGDPNYTGFIRDRIERLELSQHVKMVGEITGEAKVRHFENADVVVVPSYTESFGIVVAEALAHGVPVIVSKGAPWQRVAEIGCGLSVDNDPKHLSKAFQQITRMPLSKMGHKGRLWMQQEFAWPCMAKKMAELYESLDPHSI